MTSSCRGITCESNQAPHLLYSFSLGTKLKVVLTPIVCLRQMERVSIGLFNLVVFRTHSIDVSSKHSFGGQWELCPVPLQLVDTVRYNTLHKNNSSQTMLWHTHKNIDNEKHNYMVMQ